MLTTQFQTNVQRGNKIMPATLQKDDVVSERETNHDRQKIKEHERVVVITTGGSRGAGVGARLDRLTPVGCYPSSTQTHVC